MGIKLNKEQVRLGKQMLKDRGYTPPKQNVNSGIKTTNTVNDEKNDEKNPKTIKDIIGLGADPIVDLPSKNDVDLFANGNANQKAVGIAKKAFDVIDSKRDNSTANLIAEHKANSRQLGTKGILGMENQPPIKLPTDEEYKTMSARYNASNAIGRYGINADTFDENDFAKWAVQHNYTQRFGASGIEYTPKYKNGKKLTTDTEEDDFKVLSALAENNTRRKIANTDTGAAMATVSGFADGLTFGAASGVADKKNARKYEKAGLDTQNYVSQTNALKKTNETHSTANVLGNIAGSVAGTVAMGQTVGGALSGVKWMSRLTPQLKNIIGSGITFAITNGAQTGFSGGSATDVVRNAAIGFVGGAAGSSLSEVVGAAGEKILFNKNLQNKIIPELARNMVSAGAFSVGDIGSTYYLHPKEERPTLGEMTKELAISFAFAGIQTGISIAGQSKQNKMVLDEIYDRMSDDFTKMTRANAKAENGGVSVNASKLADRVIKYADTMESYLSGKGVKTVIIDGKKYTFGEGARFVGQDKYVKSMIDDLRRIRTAAQQYIPHEAIASESAVSHGNTTHTVETTGVRNAKRADSDTAVNNDALGASKAAVGSQMPNADNSPQLTPEAPLVSSSAFDTSVHQKGDSAHSQSSHYYDESKAPAEFMNAVDKNLVDFVEKVKNNPTDSKSKYVIGSVTDRLNNDIKSTLGIDTADYVHNIKANTVSHILKRHGVNGVADSSLANVEDIARIGYVLDNYDTIEVLKETSKEYRDKNQNPVPMIRLSKKVDGTYYVAEAVPDTKAKSLSVVTAYIEKASARQTGDVQAPPWIVRNASAETETSIDNSVHQNDTFVNTYDTQNQQNYDNTGNSATVSDEKAKNPADNKTVNEDATDTNIINHAKEVDGLKLIDTEESVLMNGKTLITGIYELNSDKDFGRKSYKKEKLDYFRKAGNPWAETVNGTTYGHYGFYKYKDGQYLVMHLPTGMGVTGVRTESKAKSAIKALDDNLPELPISIKAFVDDYRCTGITQEMLSSIKNIINSADGPVVTEIQDGKVPFRTKAGLVGYVKNHIGDKVRVTFNNGASEVRTLESISNTSMRTKKPDGSDSFTDLKGIKYSDSGFSIDYSTGVSVTYDFINTADNAENSAAKLTTTESVENTTDNVSEKKANSKKTTELFKKLTDSIPLLMNDAVVYTATGKEFEVGEKKLSQQVYEYFESLGGTVHREGFGDVAINDKGVDSSIAHGIGRAKAIAFASVPAVIEKGRQIDYVENWKGRNYDSYVFAAPIRIGTQKAFVGVVVTKSDTDNRYYLHEVSDSEGNIIIIKKDDASFKSKSEATDNSSSLGETSSTDSIAQDSKIVNSTESGIKEIDVNALLGAVENAKPGDKIKLSDYEKHDSAKHTLNNRPESDIIEKNTDKDGVENVHNRVLERESGNNDEVRKSEPVSEVEEKRNIGTDDRELGKNVASESGTHIQPPETAAFAAEQHDSRDNNDRIRKSDDSDGNSGTGIDGNNNVDVAEHGGKSKDFVITKTVAEDIDKTAPSMTDNIKAIETLHAIEKSGKAPTKTQQGLLAKFKGWGGLSGSFYGENRIKLQELMSESELKAAQSTVNDAYFTPTGVIDGIYKGLSHLGFEGGNILEPSMGVGNFFGRMPKAIKDSSSLFGVEIDSISGRIAQCLYPSANIEIAPFQDVAYKDGAFDLIIGNVPFGEVKYNYKGKKYLIHDYFFVKAMDKLNDSGVLMFLTTKGTLDKLDSTTRTELSNRGKLLGAYRLPSDVFTKSAGASVVTDLIIMQKTSDTNGENFINLDTVSTEDGEFSVNEYFVNHPENIIGKLTSRRDWRSGKSVLDVTATGNVAEQLVKAIRKLPKNLLSGVQTVSSVDVTENNTPVQTFSVAENDTVEYIDAATGEVKQIKGKSAKAAKDYVALKEAYQELVDATLGDYETGYIENKRKTLNAVYDGFVKKHGALDKNKKLLSADNDFYKMSGLEVYDTKSKKIVKSEMFTKDTLGKRKPKKADSVLDALSISIGETGGVNINRIADLTGISEGEAIKQLDDRVVYTPDGTYELNEVYLSGNVREKYEAVKGKKGFEKNEKMLEAVIPTDIPAKDITPQFGAPWIKSEYVADFLKETFHLYSKPTVNYDPTSGTWSVSGNTWGDNTLLTNKYGTKYMDAVKIAEKALNMRRIVVTDRDTKKMLVGETRAAQQKAEDIKAAFEEWCFKDTDRRKDLVATFNKKFNSNRNMDFSELAKYLTFDGLTDTFKLRDYQKRAVARAVFNGNTLLAHGVGTGKTAEMIAIAMELKRMGIAKKNMMVVPNHKVADFRNDILKMYPSAKVAYLEKGANSVQRQRFYALVASNDFDIAIIPHSAFGMLDVSADTKKAFVNNQISELEEVLTAAQAEKGKVDGRFISTLENQKKRLEEKLKFVTESAKDSGNIFEELGVDSLFVDEAHNFKNLPFYSKLSRVAGVAIKQSNNKTRASRAENMFMITDYLNRNSGRIVFGTATPITNSMSEIYNMTRFLRPDILSDSGLQSFDAWASMFGSIVNQAEVDPSGRNMRMKERFSKFKNVSQMIEQFRRMADILKTGDVIRELPKAERIDVYSEPNKIQEEFLDIVDEMIDDIRINGQRADHNMLEVTTAGQMAAIDLRLVASYFDGKYSLDELNLPNNRTSQVAQKVYKEYVDSNETKGTQFIFCDKGVHDNPDAKYGFYVYGDLINKLVALGIPRNEIAIAQEFENKADLSAKVNTGEIRVLIGSTAVMGEGMNAQNKAVALHHMTVPDRPSDIEQREGRIIRYGNENKNVRIYRYIQEKSYDSYQWQMQERKASFINQALSGGTVSELEEMSDFQLSAREAKAIASGNPLLLEKIEIEDKLNNLKSIRNKFSTDKLEMKDRLALLPNMIAKKEKIIADTTADVKTVHDNTSKDFEITLGKNKYIERTKAAEALKKGLENAPRNGTRIKIGSYRGLDMYYTSSFDKGTHFILKGNGEYSALGGDSASGNITRITNLAEKIGENLEVDKALVANYKAEIETLKKEVDAEFPRAKELEELQAKLNDIDTQLGINVSEVDMSDVIVDDEAGSDDVESSKDIDAAESASRWTAERIEGGKDKGVTLSNIVDEISAKFNIPISSGKVADREASGIYKKQAEAIRTRISNNLPTISHELGHHLDKQYELSSLKSVDEIKGIVSDEFLDKYPAEKINGELVAEFVRAYLKNINEANRLCPRFYSDFTSALSKEDLKAVNEIAASVNEYLSYDISKRYDAAIVSSQKKEKLSFRDKWHKWYSDWVDSFHPQKQVVDYVENVTGKTLSGKNNAYVLATNSLNAHTIANFLICEGFRDLDGNIVDAKSFIDCIGMVDSKNVKLLDKYLVLRHSLEWIAPEQKDVTAKRVFADDTLENTEEIKKQIAKIEKIHPEIKTAAENLYEYQNNVLEHFVIPAGGMTDDTLRELNRMYPSYVPFYRAKGKKSGLAKGTFANQRSPIIRAKGSGELIISPTESIIRNTEKMVKYALRNQVMQELANYADNVDGFGQFMEKVPPDMIPHTVNISGLKESFTDALQQVVNSGEDYFAVSDLFEGLFGDTITDFTPVANANKRIVTVMRSGKPSYYQIHNDEFYKSVAELAPQQVSGLLKISQTVMQPMKLLITQNNPIFAATNAIRDYGTAYKLSKINNPVTFAWKYIQALGGIVSNSDAYKQYKAMGGGHSSELSANIENISKTLREVAQKDMGKARRLAYSIFRHPVETVASLNDVIESTPRFMEFQRTLENGGDFQQAIYNADDITTNFKKSGKGAAAKAVNKLIMFNNASIQGLDKLFRTITDKEPKKRYKTLLKWLLHAFIIGVIGWIWNKEVDEEGYKNLSSYKKNNFYNFAIGDGKFVSLPKPRENALLDSFTERTMEYFAEENKDAFYDFGIYLASQLLPPMLPETLHPVDAVHSVLGGTVLGGLVDVGFNQDFKGTPIESEYDKYNPSNERYSESTTKLAYGLGQTRLARELDMSPKKIDHLISSYTGILGQVNKALFPVSDSRRDASLGLRNKFISDSNYSTDVLNRMYDNQEKAERAFNYSGSVGDGVEYENNSIITSYISGMNKAIKAMPEDKQRNGRAYLLRNLSNWNYENTASQSNMLSNLDGQAIDRNAIFDTLPSSSLEWTVNKQKYVYQMTPQEYHKYISDYLTVIENVRKRYGRDTVESYEAAKTAANKYMSEYKKSILKRQYLSKATAKGE
jgi:N12 class adenine-specific DNA methylase